MDEILVPSTFLSVFKKNYVSECFAHVCVHKCAWYPRRPEEGFRAPGISHWCWEALSGPWELSPSPEQGQQVLLATESPLHCWLKTSVDLWWERVAFRRLCTHRFTPCTCPDCAPGTARDPRNREMHNTPHGASRRASCGRSLEISNVNTAGQMTSSHLILGIWFSLLWRGSRRVWIEPWVLAAREECSIRNV